MRFLQRSRGRLDAVAVVAAALLIVGPVLVSDNGFTTDWTNDLWLAWVQQHAISAHLLPTYYLSAAGGAAVCPTCSLGVFYPGFMFYGGPLYTLIGGLGALLGGHIVLAAAVMMLLAAAAAYGGLLWLARQLGVTSWLAHLPALTFVTSAYYVTDLYGRGDWNEWFGVSMLPLLLACGWRLARAPRVELRTSALGVLALVVFAGAHNLTLLLGTAFSVVLIAGLRLALGRSVAPVSPRRLGVIGVLLVAAVAVDAWVLVPILADGHNSRIATAMQYPWATSAAFNTPGMVLFPFRRAAAAFPTVPGLYVQAPVWLAAWSLLTLGLLWRRLTWPLRRAGLGLLALLGAMLIAIFSQGIWDALPLHGLIQFPYRVGSYVALDIAGLTLLAAVALERSGRRRILPLAAAGAAGVSLILCVWQLAVPDDRGPLGLVHRSDALVSAHRLPSTYYAIGDYNDTSAPVVPTHATVTIPADGVGVGNAATVTLDPPPGPAPFATDIAAGPYAVELHGGIVVVGRTPDGFLVVRRRPADLTGPVRVRLTPPGGLTVHGSAILSLVAALLLLATGLGVVVRRVLSGSGLSGPDPSPGTMPQRPPG